MGSHRRPAGPVEWVPRRACLALSLPACLAVASPAGGQDGTRQPPVDWLSSCEVGGETGWCGTYEVWEDRGARTGRRIGLNVIVLPARSGTPAPDALVWLHGGPGGAATESGPAIGSLLAASRETRDYLLVDQRGTGRSHPLDCPVPDEGAPLQVHFEEFLPPDYVRACLAAQDADVAQYTTPIAMDDLDDVREALGYEQLTLFGGSYGTRAALIYMRRHPGSVRAAVLKGVAPTNMRNPLPFAKALEVGLDGVFRACGAEEACAAAFPDLEDDWRRVVERFESGPVTTTVTFRGRTEEVTISKGVFADGIRHILYSVGASRILPLLIHEAASGDFSRFAARELEQALGFATALSTGMFLTVTCSEDLRFLTEEEIRRETAGTFFGDYRVQRQLAACQIWGRGDVDASYEAPVTVDVPTLLISGEFDTATPVAGASRVAEHLPRAVHLVVPNESHGFANPSCEATLINRFIMQGGAEGLDTTCLAETRRPPFVTGGR